MTETDLLQIWNLIHWRLFVIWCLEFDAFLRYALCAMRYGIRCWR